MSNRESGEVGVPMLVVALILACILVQNGYQTFQIIDDRDRLGQQIAAQESAVQDAEKVRAQLLSIAGASPFAHSGSTSNNDSKYVRYICTASSPRTCML